MDEYGALATRDKSNFVMDGDHEETGNDDDIQTDNKKVERDRGQAAHQSKHLEDEKPNKKIYKEPLTQGGSIYKGSAGENLNNIVNEEKLVKEDEKSNNNIFKESSTQAGTIYKGGEKEHMYTGSIKERNPKTECKTSKKEGREGKQVNEKEEKEKELQNSKEKNMKEIDTEKEEEKSKNIEIKEKTKEPLQLPLRIKLSNPYPGEPPYLQRRNYPKAI